MVKDERHCHGGKELPAPSWINADAEEVYIHDGFISGNDYSNSKVDKNSYLMGIVDGILLAPFYGAEKRKTKWFEDCVESMDDNQVKAIVDKYMREHPEERKENMHTIFYRVFLQICPDSPFKNSKQ